mgnify:CR=1 FL=1
MVNLLIAVVSDSYDSAMVATAELFAEALHKGEHGEDNGAFIVTANPAEVASRFACYEKHMSTAPKTTRDHTERIKIRDCQRRPRKQRGMRRKRKIAMVNPTESEAIAETR